MRSITDLLPWEELDNFLYLGAALLMLVIIANLAADSPAADMGKIILGAVIVKIKEKGGQP